MNFFVLIVLVVLMKIVDKFIEKISFIIFLKKGSKCLNNFQVDKVSQVKHTHIYNLYDVILHICQIFYRIW